MLQSLPGIEVHSVENPDLTDVLLLKPGVGHGVHTQASLTSRNFILDLIFTIMVHSPSFLSVSSPWFLVALVLADALSRVGPRNLSPC